jgi:HK97 gp10 family phage protein
MQRPHMAGNVKAKLSLDKNAYAKHKAALKELEKAVRKAIIEEALMAGGQLIYDDAQVWAPGPIVITLVSGRTLRKKVDPRFAKVVKGNTKLVAIGPDAKHWYYRFFEFGATPHDIKPKKAKTLRFEGKDGFVFARYASSTGGIRMRPFLRPAVDKNKTAAVIAMGDVLNREIKKAARA